MACRRRHPISRASTFTENLSSSSSSSSNDFNPQISRFSTFKEDSRSHFFRDEASSPPPASPYSSSSSSSVAAQAIRAASAYRESEFSSTNGESASMKLNSPNSQRLNRSQQVNSPCPSSCFFLLVTWLVVLFLNWGFGGWIWKSCYDYDSMYIIGWLIGRKHFPQKMEMDSRVDPHFLIFCGSGNLCHLVFNAESRSKLMRNFFPPPVSHG